MSFTNLPQGMYLVEEADGASYGTFSPFLVAIPYMEDGENWIYDVVTYTKGVSNKQGSLEVTKYLAYMNPDTGKLLYLQAPMQAIMLVCSVMRTERFRVVKIM